MSVIVKNETACEIIESTFPKAKIKYLEKYDNFESDCHILFEYLSGNLDRDVPSEAVDEIWHWMILYTEKYGKFCQEHFGKFIHHVPNDSITNESCNGNCGHCNNGSHCKWESCGPGGGCRWPD